MPTRPAISGSPEKPRRRRHRRRRRSAHASTSTSPQDISKPSRWESHERQRKLCALGIYTLILTPIIIGLVALSLAPENRSVRVAVPALPPPAAPTPDIGHQVFRFNGSHTETIEPVYKISHREIPQEESDQELVRNFILNLGEDEAISPAALAKRLRCSRTAILEAAGELNAHLSLVIQGNSGTYITHPDTVKKYASPIDLPAGLASTPRPEKLSPASRNALPAQAPSIGPNGVPITAPTASDETPGSSVAEK